jgi:hypothetical protein
VNDATTLLPKTICTGRGAAFASTCKEPLVGFPAAHCRFIVIPPRVRAPFMDPDAHWVGRAGRRVMTRGVETVGTSGACKIAF